MSSSPMTLKEKIVAASFLAVLLYAAAAALWFFVQQDAWKKAFRNYDRAEKKYQSEKRLISKTNEWEERYEEARSKMPMFDVDATDTDTTWMRKMDDFSMKYKVIIAQTDIENEESTGDVFSRTISVRNFEGSLESLVKFMFELENSSSGTFDVKTLSLKPSNKAGYLKGSFAISCAYMKQSSDE